MSNELMNCKIRNERGFSLLGIVMLLVLLGAMMGVGAGMIGPMTKKAQIVKTRKIINAAIDSIISYGASGNKLPATGSFSSTVKNPNDAWTKSLYYVLDSNLTDTSVGGICGRKTTDLTVKVCPDSGCSSPTKTINDVAFIVLSSSADFNNQTAGTQAVSSATTVNVYASDVSIDDYATDINSADPYDDLVRWVTIDELRAQAGCTFPQLRIVNNELPRGNRNNVYSATVFGDGGVPYSSGGNYRWCREESEAVTGLTFTPSTSSADCLSETESNWTKADTLVISGTPTDSGSFVFTFFARDDNDQSGTDDNITQRAFVMTINALAADACTEYRVWNNLSYTRYFVREGDCDSISDGDEVTSENKFLNSGEDLKRYSSWSCSSGLESTLTYAEAQAADSNEDCCLYFNETDRDCASGGGGGGSGGWGGGWGGGGW
jgi:type II secretory pathway pseudopilin PulG